MIKNGKITKILRLFGNKEKFKLTKCNIVFLNKSLKKNLGILNSQNKKFEVYNFLFL